VSLAGLQRSFQAYLLGEDSDLYSEVLGPRLNFIKKRLMIYGDAYFLRLLEVLTTVFPTLSQWMGEKKFERLAFEYVEKYPSKHFSVDVFGQNLSEYLANHSPYQRQIFLSELAAFEWSLNRVIDAPDGALLTRQDLAAVPETVWADMRMVVHPSLAMRTYQWNAVAVYEATQQGLPQPKSERLKTPASYIVWRKDLAVQYAALTAEEAAAMSAILAGQSFADICQTLCQWLPETEVAPYTVNLLIHWLDAEIFSAVTL
jgi:hypothetical protein